MHKQRSWIIAVVLAVLASGGLVSRAEVSAQVDAMGAYVETVVTTNASSKNLRIWEVLRAKKNSVPLNPEGDAAGDMWPDIIENPFDGNRPWVVWSAFNGGEYDLKWSRWLDGGWAPVRLLEEPFPSPGDDLDPDLALDSTGRAFVTWWRNEGGVGRIYLSMFLSSRWSGTWAVTTGKLDSRYPAIVLETDSQIRIDFETPDGPGSVWVLFNRPDTITDEADPIENDLLSNEPERPSDDEFGQ